MGRYQSILLLLAMAGIGGQLPGNLHRILKDVTPEQREAAMDSDIQQSLSRLTGLDQPRDVRDAVAQTPVTAKFQEVFDPKWALMASAGIKRNVREFYARWEAPAVKYSLSASLTLLLLAFLALTAGSKGLCRFFASICHYLARKWLLLMSFVCVIGFTTFGVDLWSILPSSLWMTPVVSVLVAGAMLKIVDINYPIWNSTLSGLFAPISSCLLAVAWEHLDFFRAYL